MAETTRHGKHEATKQFTPLAAEDLRLTELRVYPVKSAKGVSLGSSQVVDTGLEYDRRWMVVDDEGGFITQRTEPRLCFIETELEPTRLVLRSPGHGEVSVPLTEEPGARKSVTVWHDTLDAVAEPEEVSAFLSDLLGVRRHLVRFPDAGVRAVPAENGRERSERETGERVRFADAYPFLLISQGSLDLLNEKIVANGGEPVAMERFRPNLVIAGCEPNAEDGWSTLELGGLVFDVAKPCARCAIPSVDPATAKYGREPLKTLATYRRQDGKVMFGQNLVHRQQGELRVGDTAVATAKPPIS